ncbi:MAG: DUF1987 domain-containing protein [Bacteroidetes bacterium]|nr:DUF1987 domain-containing protein [Bacteroidota bacterium]
MTPLVIESTDLTPKICFMPDKKEFEISGESRPENVRKFYEPVMDWIDSYKDHLHTNKAKGNEKLVFKFRFEYFNSTSAKFLTSIINKLDTIKQEIMPVEIEWYYDAPDEDMKNSGEEFSKMVSIPFRFFSVN